MCCLKRKVIINKITSLYEVKLKVNQGLNKIIRHVTELLICNYHTNLCNPSQILNFKLGLVSTIKLILSTLSLSLLLKLAVFSQR